MIWIFVKKSISINIKLNIPDNYVNIKILQPHWWNAKKKKKLLLWPVADNFLIATFFIYWPYRRWLALILAFTVSGNFHEQIHQSNAIQIDDLFVVKHNLEIIFLLLWFTIVFCSILFHIHFFSCFRFRTNPWCLSALNFPTLRSHVSPLEFLLRYLFPNILNDHSHPFWISGVDRIPPGMIGTKEFLGSTSIVYSINIGEK